ncbi:MAG: hypothetical protein WBO66_02945, partial [Candidatus Moraniibacteriota bacterium]
MKQKLLWMFCITGFSFFALAYLAQAKIGSQCTAEGQTGVCTNYSKCDRNVGSTTLCDSGGDELCCLNPTSESPTGDTGYTDPAPVSDANPVIVGSASCMKYGVRGVCKTQDDLAHNPCNSGGYLFSDVCGNASFLCCPIESIPENVKRAIDNGTPNLLDPVTGADIPGGGNGGAMNGSFCILTTNEPGTCMTSDMCRANGDPGFSSVEPCVSQGMVCCRTVVNAPSSPIPSSSGGTGTPSAGGGSTGANRTGVGAAATGSAKGLYIPRGSDIGLSDAKVTNLIQNFMLWLLY